jgi:osmotically inducible protein OsmC
LTLTAVVEGIEQDDFDAIAEKAKNGCPMSVALGAIDITLGTQLQ